MQKRAKNQIAFLLVLAMVSGLFSAVPSVAFAAGGELTVLKPFTLVGSFEDNKINNFELAENAKTYRWNNTTGKFEPANTMAGVIVGNFAELRGVKGGSAEEIRVVLWQDSKDYWDAGMQWNKKLYDDGGAFSGGQEWRLPFGERLLEEYGIGGAVEDFSNIASYADLENSTYWPQHDYYNASSSETLVMLTGFKTTQQATGWACGPTSAVMVMDWFGLRGDLNEEDLAALRQKPAQGGSTNLKQMINIFEGLNALDKQGKGEWGKWKIFSSYDIVKDYKIEKPEGGKYDLTAVDEIMDGSLILELLSEGIPILAGWNSFGGHWQVIIGYDTMGSEDTKDHVLILADPYDSTDHINDGYTIQSFERFVYDWSAGFDPDFRHGIFVVAVPENWKYTPKTGGGTVEYKKGYDGDASDAMKLAYGRTAADLDKFYSSTPWRGSNGLAGAATGGYERVPNDYVNVSPYYAHYDFYSWKTGKSPVSGGNLVMLENFRTQQQTTEWTCGLTCALMAMEWFDANPSLPKLLEGYTYPEFSALVKKYENLKFSGLFDERQTEINLARLRGADRSEPGATTLNDMKNIFDSLNKDTDYLNAMAQENGWKTLRKWAYITTDDLSADGAADGRYLADGLADEGMIPYYLGLGYPILVGWDEWGGHWQVAVGYDDMGTDETPDDVLILADPYDTTDHNQDGYYLEAFERLVYGWGAAFDSRRSDVFLIPYLIETNIPAAPSAVKLIGAHTDENYFTGIAETAKNSGIWKLSFTVKEIYAGMKVKSVKYEIEIEAKNANVDGSYDLGAYTLIYDIKGSGSNIKEFRIVMNK